MTVIRGGVRCEPVRHGLPRMNRTAQKPGRNTLAGSTMASFPPPYGGNIPEAPSNQPVNANQDHPLAPTPDGSLVAGQSPAPLYPPQLSQPTPAPPFIAPPQSPGQQPHHPPVIRSIPSPQGSPTRTLDEFVDHFLSTGADDENPPKLHADPIPTDCSDFDRLKILILRRAYSDAILLTHRLLSGPNSHYATIWQGLLHGGSHNNTLALESQQQELVEIAMLHIHALLKLKRYSEFKEEVQSWSFLDDSPGWVPLRLRIAVASGLEESQEDGDSQKSIDALWKLRSNVADEDRKSTIWMDQILCNVYCRKKQWRMALICLQNVLDILPEACKDAAPDFQPLLGATYKCEVLSRQGRILLQAGATTQASIIFQQAGTLWTSTSTELAPKHIAIAVMPAQLAMNEGLLAFANQKYDFALECFHQAARKLSTLCRDNPPTVEDILSDDNALAMASPHILYSECMNNVALCAIYTVS